MRTTNRWTLALFFNLIDVCISNAYLLFIAANPTWKPNDRSRRRIFLQWLAKNLAYEHVKQRRNTPGLQNSLISKIDTFLDNYSSLYLPKSCNYCSSTEELQSCEACKQTTCSIHYVNCTLYLCPNCAGNSEHQFLEKVQGRKRCEFCRFKPNSKTSVQCHNCSAYVCANHQNRTTAEYLFCRECKLKYNY